MKKTTKEYAEKLAKEWYTPKQWTEDKYREYAQYNFTHGYMKAIEENNVEELIESLEEVAEALRCVEFENGDHGEDTEMFKKAKTALKKAIS